MSFTLCSNQLYLHNHYLLYFYPALITSPIVFIVINIVKEAIEYKLERLNTTLIRSIYNTPIYNRLMYCPEPDLHKSTSD